jgi:Transcriptional regulator
MRKSKIETAETRRRIIEVAAQQFRSKGIQATGVNEVMSEAGLTHGGFYRHFESKNQLVAEACELGFTAVVDSFNALASNAQGKAGFKSIIDDYVSTGHRDNAADGCPLAGMGSELARADETTREAATEGFNRMVAVLAERVGDSQADTANSDAVFALAAMVGALTLSRIVTDPAASDAILQTVKRHLNAS